MYIWFKLVINHCYLTESLMPDKPDDLFNCFQNQKYVLLSEYVVAMKIDLSQLWPE
jgi:hypothetical protein